MRDGFIDCGDGEVEVGGNLMGCRWLGGGLGALALHQFLAFVVSDGVYQVCYNKLSIFYRFRQNWMVRKMLVWHKLYIQFRSRLNPMVHLLRRAQFQYILFRSQPNPMVHLLRNAQIQYIHLRSQPNPMESSAPHHFQ